MKPILKIIICLLFVSLSVGRAAAQTYLTPATVNPAAEADYTRLNVSLSAYHQAAGVTGSVRGGLLNVGVPVNYVGGRDGKYLFAGMTVTDRNVNLTNDMTAMLRYAMRFQVAYNLYLSAGSAAGIDYTHVAVDRLIEDGGYDPAWQGMKPNRVYFTGQTGVQLHNDRFAVGLFGGYPYGGTHIGLNARFRTNPDRKCAFEAYAYGYYYAAKGHKRWYGDFYIQGVLGRALALGVGYDTDNRMQAIATLSVKGLHVTYSCSFYNFSVGKAGVNTLQHSVTLGLTFRSKADKEDNEYYK